MAKSTVPTFEEAMIKLEDIVNKLEVGSLGLSESIAEFENAIKLINKYKDLYPEARVEVVWLMDKDHTPECDRYFETNDFYAMYTEGLEGHISH
jgi:exodeoxyribonuclease VII small subunit